MPGFSRPRLNSNNENVPKVLQSEASLLFGTCTLRKPDSLVIPPGAFQSHACGLGPAWHSQNDDVPTCPPVGGTYQLPVFWAVPQNSKLGFLK